MSDRAANPAGRHARWTRLLARWGVAIIVVGAAVNVILAWQSVRAGASEALRAVSPGWLGVALLLGVLPWLFTASRVWMWARFLGSPVTWRSAFRVGVGTELGSSVSPKLIGGAPVKIGLLMEAGVRPGTSASILMLDNLSDAVFFTLVAPAIAFATARWRVPEVQEVLGRVVARAAAVGPWILVAIVAVAAFVRWRRGRRRTRGASGSVRAALGRVRDDFFGAYALVGRQGKSRVVAAIALTTGLWIGRCSVATAVLYGLGQSGDPILLFLLQWVVFMLMVFVPTPGAALGAEASFAAVLDGFVAEGVLGVVTAGWRFFSFYAPLMAALAVMPLTGARFRVARDPEDDARPVPPPASP